MNKSELILNLFTFQNQVKLLHWQEMGEGSYARHTAYGEFYDKLAVNVDELIECYQGKYNEIIKLNGEGKTFIIDSDKLKPIDFLTRFHKYLSEDVFDKGIFSDKDLDLQDIIIAILNDINKLKYKLIFLK
jgi:DNA-binding ferritin-like protein